MLPRYQNSAQKRQESYDLADKIMTLSSIHQVDPLLATLVIKKESSFVKTSVGKAGEIGLFQIHGVAAKGATKQQLFDIDINLQLGIQSLKEGKFKCGYELWKIAEYHHTGRCIDEQTIYSKWIVKKYNYYKKLISNIGEIEKINKNIKIII